MASSFENRAVSFCPMYHFAPVSPILWQSQEPSQKHMLKLIDKAIFEILRSATGYFFMFLRLMICFRFQNRFLKKIRDTINKSISFDPDQARHFVGPDMDSN